jgi:hypothetical protein
MAEGSGGGVADEEGEGGGAEEKGEQESEEGSEVAGAGVVLCGHGGVGVSFGAARREDRGG